MQEKSYICIGELKILMNGYCSDVMRHGDVLPQNIPMFYSTTPGCYGVKHPGVVGIQYQCCLLYTSGRVRLTADWYNKVSKDILLELAQPTHMGYSSLLMN